MRGGYFYWSPVIYDAMLYVLYHGRPQERFRAVAEHVPPGAHVVDVCAGTSMLYRQLADKAVRYQAIDINPRLVRRLREQGVDAQCCDVAVEPIPQADVVVMCSSLYQFHPDCRRVVDAMVTSARQRCVVLEPVHNVAHSRWGFMRRIASLGGAVNGRTFPFYFSPATFEDLARDHDGLQTLTTLENGRDMMAVFAGSAPSTEAARHEN